MASSRVSCLLAGAVACCVAVPAFAGNCPEFVGRWPYGPSYAVAVAGNHAYFGSGTVLLVADSGDDRTSLRDWASPRVIGELILDDFVLDISASRGYVYLAAGYGGLKVIDVNRPSNPVQVGSVSAGPFVHRLAVSEEHAYVVAGGDLRIIEVSDPERAAEVAFLDFLSPDLELHWSAIDVAISGHFAYVALGDGDLLVIDVSVPSNPTIVGRYEFNDLGDAVAVTVDGDYAYLVHRRPGLGYRLRVIDISDPENPFGLGLVDCGGRTSSIAVLDGYVFVADSSSGLRLIDVSEPSNPIEVGFVYTPGEPSDVAVSAERAFVADAQGGLRVIDVTSPETTDEIGFVETPGYTVSVAVSQNYAYLTDGNGLRVIDTSSPSRPVEVGYLGTPGSAIAVAVADGYAYVADHDGGLRIANVSDPRNPVEVSSLVGVGDAIDVSVSDGYVYVADANGALRVVDVSTPNNPIVTGIIENLEDVEGVAACGCYAYIVEYWGGLRILDASTASSPFEVGSWEVWGANDVDVVDGYAYMTYNEPRSPWGGGGLRIIDVSNPLSPIEVSGYRVPADFLWTEGVASSDNLVYMATTSGLWVLDAAFADAPVKLGDIGTKSTALDVGVFDNLVYVAVHSAGLEIMDVSQCKMARAPRHPRGRMIP